MKDISEKSNSLLLVLLRLLPVFIIIAGCVYYTEQPTIRWNEDLCQYKTIHYQKGDVDLAIFGSSATMRSIHAPYITDEVHKSYGKNAVVYDFSRAQRGMGHYYIIAKELLESRRVKRILVEYNNSHNNGRHALFYLKAGVSDLLTEIETNKHKNLIERSALFLNLYFARITKRWEMYFLDKIKPSKLPKKIKKAKTIDCNGHREGVEPFNLLQAEMRHSVNWLNKRRSWNLLEDREIRNTEYVKKLIQLAKEHNTEIVFFHAIKRYTSIMSDEMLEKFEEYFNAPIVQPDTVTIKKWFDDDRSYNDTSHMTAVGSRYFAEWLATELQAW